jgi:nucleoside-diphosphate-sugar epimerase
VRVLITGCMGYVGPVLAKYLKNKYSDICLRGYDTGYFGHSLTGVDYMPEIMLETLHIGDIRDISAMHLKDVDAVVHLAAISNDPMGNQFENVTNLINLQASLHLVEMSAKCGVKNFVFASSCSIYGLSEGAAKKETDTTAPLTAYARSKIGMENEISKIDLKSMNFTSLRFATACGMSPRLRLDLVLNDFVACAITAKKITVLSDGSPWRPLIDVEDMARAIDWAVHRTTDNGGSFLIVNAGRNENNYQVGELAAAVAKHLEGTEIEINKNALPDKRSYKVDFSLFRTLAHDFLPEVTLDESIVRLKLGFGRMVFDDKNFRESIYMRLNTIRRHLSDRRLDDNLRWINERI